MTSYSVQTLHALACVISLLFHEATVDDEDDVVNSNGSFGKVRRQNDLSDARWRSSKEETQVKAKPSK